MSQIYKNKQSQYLQQAATERRGHPSACSEIEGGKFDASTKYCRFCGLGACKFCDTRETSKSSTCPCLQGENPRALGRRNTKAPSDIVASRKSGLQKASALQRNPSGANCWSTCCNDCWVTACTSASEGALEHATNASVSTAVNTVFKNFMDPPV